TRSWIAQVAVHPNPRYVAFNDLDGVHVWDALAGRVVWARPMPEEIRSGVTPGSYASCLTFSPDGRRLATGLPDSTILVWDIPLPQRRERLAAGELAALQADLVGADAARAWRAVWRLAEFPKEALPIVRASLKPKVAANPEPIGPLLEALD